MFTYKINRNPNSFVVVKIYGNHFKTIVIVEGESK